MNKQVQDFISSELDLLNGEKNLVLSQLYGVIPLLWAFASASILTYFEGKSANSQMSMSWILGIYVTICVVGAYYLFLMSVLRRNKTKAAGLRTKIYGELEIPTEFFEEEKTVGRRGIVIFFLLFTSMFPASKAALLVIAFSIHDFSKLHVALIVYAIAFQIFFCIALAGELRFAKDQSTRFVG